MEIKEWLGTQLGVDIWTNKYQYNNETFEQWLDRVSAGDEEVKGLIRDKKFLPGGRILSNRGLNKLGKKVTYSNCYVLDTNDSIEDIYQTCSNLARTFSVGGGCGVDISKLRPNGAKVNNTAKTTTGACSFMDTFSQVAETIGQNGRRAALMLSMDVNHPEIEEFIDIKKDLTKVTKANISVRVDNKFMHKVINNEMHTCKFVVEPSGEVITKEVNAKELFMKLCKNNWDMAEPGILYWDKIKNYNILSEDEEFEYGGVNPCFTGDMKLLTTNGYIPMKELEDKEVRLLNIYGVESKGKVWCSGEKETIKVILSNGSEITCTPNHVFMTVEGEECEAKDLKGKYIMPNTSRYINPNRELIKLGFIQGDGQLTRLSSEYHQGLEVNIGYKDGDILELFSDEEFTRKSDKAIYLQGYKDKLIHLGFSQEILPHRVMPSTYKSWSKNDKAGFLQGCYSANGSIIKKHRISYKTTCKQFALELMDTLLNDFNIKANLTINKPHKVKFSNGEYECRESYDININKYNDIIKFHQYINFYQCYKQIQLNNLIKYKAPYVRNIKPNGITKVYDFTEPLTHWGVVEGFVVHNCAEEPLPVGGSCLLGSFNLSAYVKDNEFKFEEFKRDIKIVVKGMNDVLDEGLPLHPLQIQRDTVRDYRQIGIGIMGIADMLIKLELKYGSDEAVALCDKIGFVLADTSMRESALLAKELGAYPKCKKELVLESEFVKNNATEETKKLIKEYGLRNSQLLTIAPTGSLSTMLGISGGIEPIFANSYTRKTESLHGEDVYYKVYTPIVDEYMKKNDVEREEDLPDFFVTSSTLNPHQRVLMQGVWQDHIDASISSTVNLPNEATVEDVYEIYTDAWKRGLKGITIYRSGCKREGVLTTGETKNEDTTELKRGEYEKTPDSIIEIKRKLKSGCGKMMLHIGIIPEEKRIFDVYVTNSSKGGCVLNIQNLAITMSNALRTGSSLESLKKSYEGTGSCPSYAMARAKGKEISKGNSCGTSILYALLDVENELKNETLPELVKLGYYDKEVKVKKEIKEDKVNIKNMTPQELIDKGLCPECGEPLIATGGCKSCSSCAWSKCE